MIKKNKQSLNYKYATDYTRDLQIYEYITIIKEYIHNQMKFSPAHAGVYIS